MLSPLLDSIQHQDINDTKKVMLIIVPCTLDSTIILLKYGRRGCPDKSYQVPCDTVYYLYFSGRG